MKISSLIRIALAFLFIIAITSKIARGNPLLKCGNHKPQHVADSAAEAAVLSKIKGCKNWDVVPAMKKSDKERLLREIEDLIRQLDTAPKRIK